MRRFLTSLQYALAVVLVVPATCITGANAQRFTGELGPGDATFNSGEYYDTYEFEVQAGQQIEARLTATAFDTYLVVVSPSGENTANDDYEDSSRMSAVVLTATEGGAWKAMVTSYTSAETGTYELVVTLTGGAAPAAGVRVEYGVLEAGDAALTTGEYTDAYELEGRQGERVILDLNTSTFDPYLIFKRPNGEQYDNDDHEGSARRSLLTLDLPESGTYRILVTSYKPDMGGAYTLKITQNEAVAEGSARRTEQGRLEDGDHTLRGGEYADTYTFEGAPGQRLRLDVLSSEFDTYLLLKTPSGEQIENDDADDLPRHSVIDKSLPESGTYTVAVTSYEAGETGAYELVIDLQAARDTPSRQRDVSAITMSERVTGQLEVGDLTLENGEYQDLYVFEGNARENVVVEMVSSDFDTYLALITPSDDVIRNDDYEGSAAVSRIELALPASGRYRIVTTSYAVGETGSYTLSLREGEAEPVSEEQGRRTGRIYGLFVGISDYGGRANDLQYTATDATLIRDALMQGAGMRAEDGIVLTDADATTQQFRTSLESLARRVGPDDLFVLFFSGHGGRYERETIQPADPDAIDESLEFYDAEILDDALSTMLDAVGAGTQLLVMDACFSGGFSKDVISKPGRMGMFSSEEDVTSSVAAKFRAGGYLSQFFADAVGRGLADDDEDGAITAIELSQYVYERYRGEVKSGGADDVVVTSSRQLGYQKLIVDRGSIRPYNALFYRQ